MAEKVEEKETSKEETEKKAAEQPKEDEKPKATLEVSYPEKKLKNGEVFLKRKTGKPRFRKIVSKNHQAQLYRYEQGQWVQKSVYPEKGKPIHDLKWHLKNKWGSTEKNAIEK